METKELKVRVCPICGQEYTDRPAISRTDGETPICPDCGTRQALESLGIDTDEQKKSSQQFTAAWAEIHRTVPDSLSDICVHIDLIIPPN